MTYAKVTLKSGEKTFVAFEDEATEIVAKCNLPMCTTLQRKDITNEQVHFWYYGDRTIKDVEKNPIAQ